MIAQKAVAVLVALLAVALFLAPNSALTAVGSLAAAGIHGVGIAYHLALAAWALAAGIPVEVYKDYVAEDPGAHSFRKQVVVITGASSGIGEDMAKLVAADGAYLVLAARRVEKLEAVALACRKQGALDVAIVAYDAGDPQAGEALVQFALQRFQRLDVLILNAGMAGPWAKFENLSSLTALETLMNVNYWGYVRATQAAIPALKATKGRLTAVSSFYGRIPAPYQAGYSATKHAMQGFFNTLRPEMAAHGVSVTMHLPGGIATEVQSKFQTADAQQATLAMPSTFLAPSLDCARSVLRATLVREREAYYPMYAFLASEFRQAAPGLFDTGFTALVDHYMNRNLFRLQKGSGESP